MCRFVLDTAFVVQLKQPGKDDSKQGALMHVTVEGAQARLIILPADEATTQSALEFITQVDPPSQGVPMRQVRPYPNACWHLMTFSTSSGCQDLALLLSFARHACSARIKTNVDLHCVLCVQVCNGLSMAVSRFAMAMAVMCVQVQKLHVDVAVQGTTVDFCGNTQVMACPVCLTHFLPPCLVPHLASPAGSLLHAKHCMQRMMLCNPLPHTNADTKKVLHGDCRPDQTKPLCTHLHLLVSQSLRQFISPVTEMLHAAAYAG